MVDFKMLLDRILAVGRNRAPVIKIMSFALIGAVNAIIDFAVFTAAYRLLALTLILSNVMSWSIAVCCSYTMNSKITFRRETNGVLTRNDFLRFVGSGIFGLIVTTTSLVILSHYANIWAAKFISIVVGFIVNFSMS